MKNTVTVSKCKHPKCTHRVRYPGPNGKRVDKFFTNETAALAFAKIQRKETGEMGTDFGSMSEEERSALTFWRTFSESATPTPPDLLTVLRDYKTNYMASTASVTIDAAVEVFLAHQEADGSSEKHLASLRSRLGRFAADNGHQLVSSISVGSFTVWLNGLRAKRADKKGEKLGAVTRHNLSRTLRSFFVFATDRGWTLSNPVPTAKRSKSKTSKLATRTAPAIMLPANVARFMSAVQVTSSGLTSFWAVKFFAGIRDAEAARMDWSMIDLDEGEIHLPAEVSKTGEARTVKIEPNLDAWLRPFIKTAGSIVASDKTRKLGFKKVIASLNEKSGDGIVTSTFLFPSNAARHSFGTYHLFHFRNAGETALQLGHKGNPAMLHEHYKNPAAAKHAAAFWKIFPVAPANVVPMNQPVSAPSDSDVSRDKTAT